MVSRWVRTWDSRLLAPLLGVLARVGVTPNMLTVLSLAGLVMAGIVVACGHVLAAGGLLLAGGIVDGIDGELARQTGKMTPFGGFLDSICDHYGDFAFSLGLLWLYLSAGARTEVILVFAALFGSMLGSQVRARAGMAGIDTKDVGLVTRFERILLWSSGIFSAQLPLALWALAVLNNIAALQRLGYIVTHAYGHRTAATPNSQPSCPSEALGTSC